MLIGSTGEVGELNEVFQWMSEEASRGAAIDAQHAQPVRDELADVLLYVVRPADVLGVDLNEAAREKLKTNAAKCPVSRVRGSSKKYTNL